MEQHHRGSRGRMNNGKREGVCVPKAIIHSHHHSWVLYSWCDKEMDSAGGSVLRGERAWCPACQMNHVMFDVKSIFPDFGGRFSRKTAGQQP